MSAHRHPGQAPAEPPARCRTCDAPLPPRAPHRRGRARVFCGRVCRNRWHNARAWEREKRRRAREREAAERERAAQCRRAEAAHRHDRPAGPLAGERAALARPHGPGLLP